MPARAAGLRPRASQAAEAVRPWPCAASPEAMAMAKPEVMAIQLGEEAGVAPPPCASAGIANIEQINSRNSNITIFRILLFSLGIAASGWLTPCSLSRRPHAEGSAQFSVLRTVE